MSHISGVASHFYILQGLSLSDFQKLSEPSLKLQLDYYVRVTVACLEICKTSSHEVFCLVAGS